MSSQAQAYFSNMTNSVPLHDWKMWESEIKDAESRRLYEPSAMDILGVRKPSNNDTVMHDDDNEIHTHTERWVQMAIDIEEKQCVAFSFFLFSDPLIMPCRIHVQDAVRCLSRDPRDEDAKHIEHLQESLHAQFAALEAMQQNIPGMLRPSIIVQDEDIQFDDLDDDPAEGAAVPDSTIHDVRSVPGMVPVHCQLPSMPSTCDASEPWHSSVELALQRQQADWHLKRLREAIADKSFQYSHVMCVAPGKTIRNRARSAIKKLNDIICFHCRAYNKCRLAMTRLTSDHQVLSKYPLLSKQDVKASTALLSPNMPGSSTIRLSWIWQTEQSEAQQSPEAM
jgi:hypothetical protein